MAGNRQFAPWHYAKEAMLSSADGDLHLPPVEVKEQLHHMPPGFTHHPEIDDKSRRKILGNSWHLGVARFIMMFVLQWSNPSTTRASKQTGTLELGPRQMTSSGFAIPWCKDMHEHFDAAQRATHPALMEPSLSPSLQQVAECNLAWSEELDTIRSNIIHDVQELVEKWATDTHQWWTNLPKHLQMVYQDQETGYLTQVPLFVHMLEQCGYPGIKELSEDLNLGFATVGPLHRGTGWLPRCDGKYSDPLPLDVFERTNQAYLQKLRQGFVDEHWQVMLEELLADRAQGRLEGPFRAPSEWPIPSAGIPGETLLPAPTGRVCAAVCFSVCQSDKIRRCEDYIGVHSTTPLSVHQTCHTTMTSQCMSSYPSGGDKAPRKRLETGLTIWTQHTGS